MAADWIGIVIFLWPVIATLVLAKLKPLGAKKIKYCCVSIIGGYIGMFSGGFLLTGVLFLSLTGSQPGGIADFLDNNFSFVLIGLCIFIYLVLPIIIALFTYKYFSRN